VTRPADHGPAGAARTVVRHVSERSVLDRPAGLVPYAVGGRERIAACSGVAWLTDRHLAAVNLYGSHLRIYRFEPPREGAAARLDLMHELWETVSCPEHVAAAPDGSMLAVTHSRSDSHGLSLHEVDPDTRMPRPAREMMRLGRAYHGVAFAPDGRHLVFTEIASPGFVEVAETATGECVCRLENPLAPHKPKGVAFTPDGRYLFISFGPNASVGASEAAAGGALAVHRFDVLSGSIAPRPLATWRAVGEAVGGFDDCAVLPSPARRTIRVLAVDQVGDRVLALDFDTRRRTFAPAVTFVEGLSFPHAVTVSGDGRFVATANYGDDTVRIEEVPPPRFRSWRQSVKMPRLFSTWR
jgi:hypothetical protein